MKKILMILPSNPFRDPEYFDPKKVLEDAGIKVVTASSSKTAIGAEGASVNVDLLLKDVNPSDYDSVGFVGGPGASEYYNDPKAHEIARNIVSSGKLLGAICASVATIANAGVLKGKKATSFPGVTDIVKAGGAIHTGKGVETDSLIVTADGPRSAKAYGEALLKLLEK